MRGPLAVGGPLAPSGIPVNRSRSQRFDELVLDALERLERRLPNELTEVDVAVEDVPDADRSILVPDDVPLGEVLATRPRPRIVIYRRPIELRAGGPELATLVGMVVAEQVAELLGIHPDDIDAD